MIIYRILLITQCVIAVIVFIALFKYVAIYGRYLDNKTEAKGHFASYRGGWLIIEVPAVFTILFVCIGRFILDMHVSLEALLFLLIWEVHYVYRAFVFPFLNVNKTREFTISVVVGGTAFNIINGFINGWALFFTPLLDMVSLKSVSVYIGIALFFIGFITHVISDKVLREVKRANEGTYGVPYAFLHKYIAAPNYFGEILQWFGFYIATRSPAALAFVLFSCANLVPRAYKHWLWYRKNFPEYPRRRKIMIPFVL